MDYKRVWAWDEDGDGGGTWQKWSHPSGTEYVHIDEYNRVVKALEEAWECLSEDFDVCYGDLDDAVAPTLYAYLKERDEKEV